jgi:hypothetical protein
MADPVGTEFFVDGDNGDDNNVGYYNDADHATATITQALSYATASGDIVTIRGGTYYEVNLRPQMTNIQIRSYPGERATISGFTSAADKTRVSTNGRGVNVSVSGVYFENLTFEGYLDNCVDNDTASRVQSFSGCYFYDMVKSGIRYIEGDGGAQVGTFTAKGADQQPMQGWKSPVDGKGYAIVHDCKFINQCHSVGSGQVGLSVQDPFVDIRNCLFVNGEGDSNTHGVRYGTFVFGGASYENTTASFCTAVFTGSTEDVGYGLIQMRKVVNCIASSSQGGYIGIRAENHSYNCNHGGSPHATKQWMDEGGSADSAGTGDITSDPQFVDPANLDFSLQPTSPCIGAGIQYDTPTDIDGADRGGANSWKNFSDEPLQNINADFVINSQQNVISNFKTGFTVGASYTMGCYTAAGKDSNSHPGGGRSDGVPIGGLNSLSVRAIPFRFRKKPYLTTLSGNPDDKIIDGG